MFRATLYILVRSARNRLRVRLRRLREPRYLVGAVIGAAYLTFTYVIRQRAYDVRHQADLARRARAVSETAAGAGAMGVAGPVAWGVLLACLALVSWAIPVSSGLLEFSQAETAFLFPSPMGRRQLVIYRLLRSQSAVLVGALIMALAYPTGSLALRLRGLVGVWVLMMTSHVFFTGVTLARGRLSTADRARWPAWAALLLPAGAVLSLLVPLLSGGSHQPIDTASDALDRVIALAGRDPARWLLWPFTTLVRPLFSVSLGEFAVDIAVALGVYGGSIAWLLWLDARSPDAVDASVERQATAARTPQRSYSARPAPWALATRGRAETALLWKGVLQSTRTVDRRVFIRILFVLAWVMATSVLLTRSRGLGALLGVGATWTALFSLFMGPQMLRMDLRQDLAHLELLKTWPVTGAAMVRGQMLWPAIGVTLLTWAFALLAIALSLASASSAPGSARVVIWLAFLLLVPGIVFAEYTMHNAVAVLFPGWVPLGATRTRGVDAAGQRLILLVANWVGLTTALLPGALVTAALWFLLPGLRPWVVLPGALVATTVVGVEVVLVSGVLGRLFDQLDITSVERGD